MDRKLWMLTALLGTVMYGSTPAHAAGYEAWYSASTEAGRSPVFPAKVHTYYDGKTYYSKTENVMGDSFGYSVESSIDPTSVEFAKSFDAKYLGKKTIDGTECDGYQFNDPIEQQLTENWIDNTGHLYYQLVNKTVDTEAKYQRTRTSYKIDPESCSLTTDADIVSSHTPIGDNPTTVPPNDDESAYSSQGMTKTKLKPSDSQPSTSSQTTDKRPSP